MAPIAPEEAIRRARAALALPEPAPARALAVRRLDRPGEAFFLVVFGDRQATTAVATVDAASGEVGTSAHLPGARPHLPVTEAEAVALAGLASGARAELVWQPCRASRSPLYPIWQVSQGTETAYVDQQRVVWARLDPAGPGG